MPKPAGNRVLIKVKKIEKKTKNGIFLPEDAVNAEQGACKVGMVVSLGPTAYRDQPVNWCNPGDMVYFKAYAGERPMTQDIDVIYRVINDKDIFGIVEPGDLEEIAEE